MRPSSSYAAPCGRSSRVLAGVLVVGDTEAGLTDVAPRLATHGWEPAAACLLVMRQVAR